MINSFLIVPQICKTLDFGNDRFDAFDRSQCIKQKMPYSCMGPAVVFWLRSQISGEALFCYLVEISFFGKIKCSISSDQFQSKFAMPD